MQTILKHDIEELHEWLNNISRSAGWKEPDHKKALSLIRVVFQELRDCMPISSLAHLSRQLPVIIRGILFDGWHPSYHKRKHKRLEDFIISVGDKLPKRYIYEDIAIDVCAVITTMAYMIDCHEFDKIYSILPKNYKKLVQYAI